MAAGTVILILKILVVSVTVLLCVSLAALACKRPRLHGRLNTVFFILTVATLVGFEVVVRMINPNLTEEFTQEQHEALRDPLALRHSRRHPVAGDAFHRSPSIQEIPPGDGDCFHRLVDRDFCLGRLFSSALVHEHAMSEPADHEPDSKATAQQLGESFAAIVGGRDWQVDEIPEALPVEPTDDSVQTTESESPLAEPVNESTVPPSPLQIIEALLFVGGPPMTAEHAAEAIRGLRPISSASASTCSIASIG